MMLNLRLDANPINTAVPLTGLLGGAGARGEGGDSQTHSEL